MRRNPTAIPGWTQMFLLDAAVVCTDKCRATIPWRLGITEIAVFSVNNGVATMIGEVKYTYK